MRVGSVVFGVVVRCLALVALAVSAGICDAGEGPAARLDRNRVPAQGRQSAVLTVDAFGRYAVTASSSQGVALQAVDRMAGAGPVAGEAGKQDGRLDLFLDRGEQKILVRAAERGSGFATLAAHAFREQNEKPPLLVEQRLERSSLGDFEQRSYWIDVPRKRVVVLEAAGRHLADLRLWRDGTWLVDALPRMSQSQARPEQPLGVAQLTVELNPGLYLLTAYGGPSQAWTEASDAKPFYLRFGLPTLPPAMRQQFTMSEFGTDRYVVPEGPTYFRLELPSAETASLQVGGSPRDPFRPQEGYLAAIDKKSLPPVAEVVQAGGGERVVTVSAAPGKTYVLQHFDANPIVHFDGSGSYWVSSIHAGHAEDSVGASAVLTRQPHFGREEFLAEQAVEIGSAGWHRRFNLLETLTLFIKMPATGKLRVAGDGVKARYRVEPFLTSRPRDYQTPPWRPGGHVFELDRGLHVLTIEPETKGILDLRLDSGEGKPQQALSPVVAAVRFPVMQLDSGAYYTLYLNRQPGVASGAVVRPLPIDLRQALPVSQRPGEVLTIPVSVPERGTLRAVAEDGHAIDLTLVDTGRKGAALDVDPGQYRVRIEAGGSALAYSLGFQPTRLASSTPLPALPDARLAGLPKFAVVTAEAPRFLDLKRRSAETFSVRVDKAGLYQFESTGLLHTGAKVRTRTNPGLFEEAENGIGRNFQIQRYLREGDYQLTVSTQGETQGHLGVQLARTEVVDGGELREGEVARAALPVGRALAYRFRIARGGRYHLQTLGLGRNFDIRLEDAQGWPVSAPVQSGDLTQDFAAGSYRLIVLPQTAEARVLTRLEHVAETRRFKGHGPHRIGVETAIEHVWQEPAKGGARQPDQWEFLLPARAEMTIALDNEMEAALVEAGNPGRTIASINAREPWRGELPAGRYVIRASHSRRNNFVTYSLRLAATPLLAGQSRVVAAPAAIPVSVGTDGLVELQSFGAFDVRARLMDAAGETVAQNDDRPGDWNFHIGRRLLPGQYRLQVDPVGQKHAQTVVSMIVPGEVAEKPLPLGTDVDIKGTQVHVFPLQLPSDRTVLLASARSDDAVGLALEGETPQGWIGLGTEVSKAPAVALPLAGERYKAYRLRAWSADRRSQRLTLRAVAAALPSASESQWLDGHLSPVRIDEKRPDLRIAQVVLSRPGSFRLKGDPAQLAWSDSGARAAQPVGNPVIAVSGRSLLLVTGAAAGDTAAERLRLPAEDSVRLDVAAGQIAAIDLRPNAHGPSLLMAQARAAQPGIALGETREPAETGFVAGEAITVALPGKPAQARVWNAGSDAAALEVDVRQVALNQVAGKSLSFGLADGALPAHSALPLRLPGSAGRVGLTLSPASAALFVKHGIVRSTHWAGDDSVQETVATDADQLWLLNAGDTEARYGVEFVPGGSDAEAALKPGELLERNLGASGRLRVPVEVPRSDGTGYRLHVRGDTRVLWQEEGGRVANGNDLELRRSGVLWLQHQPGAVVAWIDEPQARTVEHALRWLKGLQETAVKPPQSVSLKGKQQVLAFNLDQPAMLHVRTSTPVVTQFLVEGRPARTEAHMHGARLNLPAPAGASRLLVRAIGADGLGGSATVMATPVVPLDEGAGPEVLLASGSARLFSFELKQAATLGIGIRASSDVAESTLYDERGAMQSQGAVQMPTLLPGRYFLAVELPADSAPVRVRPIVLGLKQPDTRPPYDILRRYVEAKDGAAPLIYVPPPPAPPPGEQAQSGEPTDEAAEGEGNEGEGEPMPADEGEAE
ncbi:MAG TPA: hypothetical protein VF816_16955 [Rhodocyclaceae bacterium]